MVVFFPPSTYMRRRSDSSDSDDEPGARYYYVRLEPVSSSDEVDDDDQRPTARGRRRRNRHARLILEVPDDDDDDDDDTDEEEESDDWDPCLHLGELPLRPMSRLHKACIDVLFVLATVALEGVFVWTALQQDGADKVISWFIAVLVMLPVMILILCLAAFVHLLVTSDFSWRPAPAPADEKV